MYVVINLREVYTVLGVYMLIPFIILGGSIYYIYTTGNYVNFTVGFTVVCFLYRILVRTANKAISAKRGDIDYSHGE